MKYLKEIIVNALRSWLGVDQDIDRLNKKISALQSDIERAEEEIIKRTDISVDPALHQNGWNYVFVAGRYNGSDYVRLFQIPGIEISALIDRLKSIEKIEYGKTRYIDKDFSEISTIIKHELDSE